MHSPKEGGAHHEHTVDIWEVDVAAGLDSDKPLDPEVAARIRYEICTIYRGQQYMNTPLVGAK